MTSLPISILGINSRGSLVPHYDSETDYVTLDSPVAREWPFGVNFDNLVILDFDVDKILASVEILVPRKKWKKTKIKAANADVSGCLALPGEPPTTQFVVPDNVSIGLDPDTNLAQIALSKIPGGAEVVRLSTKCSALVSNKRLLGFTFNIDFAK